ncbi:MAG: hypothetical protein DRP32_03500 [Thermotogae bacterium]|nr:MAG: hypothetical protein DRP32_03500 [Thermotogota bacterium]
MVSSNSLVKHLILLKEYFQKEYNSPLLIRDCDEKFIANIDAPGYSKNSRSRLCFDQFTTGFKYSRNQESKTFMETG